MKDQIILTQEQLRLLSEHWESMNFENDFNFNYENQILNGVITLTKGKLEILKDSDLIDVIGPGVVVGLSSIMNNKRVKYQLRIKGGSQVVLVGKSGLRDLTGLIGMNVKTKK